MRNIVALILDAALVLIVACCTVHDVFFETDGITYFWRYTSLSNILAATACLLSLPYDVAAVRGSSTTTLLPAWLRTLKLAGCATVMVTFLTVFCFLGFMVGHLQLLRDSQFFLHLVAPLLMLVVCCAVQRISTGLPRRAAALAVVLTFAYALVYLYMVVFTGQWEDFYHFNIGGMWPVSMVAMMAVAAVVSLGCWKLSGGSKR